MNIHTPRNSQSTFVMAKPGIARIRARILRLTPIEATPRRWDMFLEITSWKPLSGGMCLPVGEVISASTCDTLEGFEVGDILLADGECMGGDGIYVIWNIW